MRSAETIRESKKSDSMRRFRIRCPLFRDLRYNQGKIHHSSFYRERWLFVYQSSDLFLVRLLTRTRESVHILWI